MVIWLIGLSGAGKSTLANEVVSQIRQHNKNVVLIDGDVIRELFDNDLGYSMEDRLKNAERISRLCKFLDDQGIHVVCAILSLFVESRSWNRENLDNYFEVYIEVPVIELVKRDSKGIYKKYEEGELKNVAGMDIEFPVPENADLTIRNIDSKQEFLNHANTIANQIIALQK
jgi:adenylyl-sulfate kinase